MAAEIKRVEFVKMAEPSKASTEGARRGSPAAPGLSMIPVHRKPLQKHHVL